MPLFSIIIPLYNKEGYIKNTLETVLAQNDKDYEVIVVNDGSTDQSERIVSTFSDPKIRYFKTENKGVSSARNLGIKKAAGDFIVFLDADDLWLSHHLSNFRKSILLYPDHQIFCNNYEIQLTQNFKIPTSFSNLEPKMEPVQVLDNYFKYSLIHSIAWTSSVCLDRKLFIEESFWFDTDLPSGQDTDLWIRLGLQKAFVFNSSVSSIYKKNISNSLSKSNQINSRFRMIKKHLDTDSQLTGFRHYLNLNLFSLAIQAKALDQSKLYIEIKKEIEFSYLNQKQKLLLKTPNTIIRILIKFKTLLAYMNLNLSIFK